ncbi:MAG: hypothetical protein LBJ84_03245 [Oscillospiraceae bacterium]|nr:hypothetical protein [Oscillospiraceae bacterium]
MADYLDSDSPDKTVGGIEKHTDVPKDIIMYLLREGRISIENPDGGEPCCKLCGKPLTTGRFCDSCRNKFVDKLESLAPSPEAEKKKPETRRTDERRSRMHITSGKHSDGK